MELRHLQYFVTVAEELSFTRASRRLHVVQSGVSSAIQVLERELESPLFDRDRHRVALTDAGQVLLPEARATLAAAQAAADAVGEARAGLRGTLTIGTMPATGRVDLPAVLGRFHAAHPGVAVRLRAAACGPAELAREVTSGSLDLALLSPAGTATAGITLRQVSEEPLLLLCHQSHPLASGHQVSLEQLTAEPFIDFPPGWGSREAADQAFAAAGLARQVPFEAAQPDAVAGLVRHRLGVAFLPASAAAGHRDLATVAVPDGPPRWPVSVAEPSARRPGAAARAFVAELLGGGRYDPAAVPR